jgi:hypothetical protein
MQKALGISLAAGGATAGAGASAAAAGAAPWPALSIGALALAAIGAAVGVRWSTGSASQHAAIAPVVTPAIAADPAPRAIVEPPREHAAPGTPIVRRRIVAAATPASDLRAEIALVDAARTAVAAGADDRALVLLQHYEASYPTGTFRPEVGALRIEALAHLGHTARARMLARKFIAAHPDSPLVDRVARVSGL